jgi:hypothetical protein
VRQNNKKKGRKIKKRRGRQIPLFAEKKIENSGVLNQQIGA